MKEKILILGGTEFVGRLLVDILRKDKTKELFLFNRGKTDPDLFPEVSRIIGDRETEDIEKIKNQNYDINAIETLKEWSKLKKPSNYELHRNEAIFKI